jgi:hypothetical protein
MLALGLVRGAGSADDARAESARPLPPAAAGTAAVAELNRYRTIAGVEPVGVDAASAAPAHARYLALNRDNPAVAGLRVHTEQPGLPGYTPEGAAVAARSNIDLGSTTVEGAIRGLVDVPLHRHWMLAPALSNVGIGGEGGWWVVDLGAAIGQAWRGQPRVVAYPAPGQRGVPLTFPGRESPNPLTAIPGLAPDALVGYAVSLHFYGCDATNADGGIFAAAPGGIGAAVPSYLIQPGTVLVADGGERQVPFVLLFAQQPLLPATTYVARVTATCGVLGQRTYAWSFTTRAALNPASASASVAPPDAEGWQSVTIRLLDGDGLPAEGARAVGWRASFAYGTPSPTRQPELRATAFESDRDGTLRYDYRLGDAVSATVQLDVDYDGQRALVPATITTQGGGKLDPAALVSPDTIPLDPAARAAWEQAQGTAVVGTVAAPGGQ